MKRNVELRKALTHAAELRVPLLVEGLDRIARDTTSLERICREFPVLIMSTKEGALDTISITSAAARAEAEGKLIGQRTKDALRQAKAAGKRLGNPTNLADAQRLGAAGNRTRAEKKAVEIADALAARGGNGHSTARDIAAFLNDRGVLSGSGQTWSVEALRRPLARARAIMEDRGQSTLKTLPNFGRFA